MTKNEPCPKCGSLDTWSVTAIDKTKVIRERGLAREAEETSKEKAWSECDNCGHEWGGE